MSDTILIIGACGHIGTELTVKLRELYGVDNVIASDMNTRNLELVKSGPFEIIDAKNFNAIKDCCKNYGIDTIYLMAALLSATGEKYPMEAWDLNMNSLFHVLNLAKGGTIKKVYWPSSIAVFGPTTPKEKTPQHTFMEPSTVYGISKAAGENWAQYYFLKYGLDVRSIRYPGVIGYQSLPGGGTTDYAVDIYHKALQERKYSCFLKEDTQLPMMFMEDAIRATLQLMEAAPDQLTVRSSYNLAAMSFTPAEIADSIKAHIPEFEISYEPDFRQAIAEGWPESIDDSQAQKRKDDHQDRTGKVYQN